MRTGRALGIGLGILAALVAVAWVAVKALVHPDDFRPRIEAAVRAATGRELDLRGELRLSVFPWLALELGPASLGNPPGFGGAPFLTFTHASIRVRLLPLLSKRLEVGRVEVDGLDLDLRMNADGRGNWQGFGRPAAPAGTAPPPPGRHALLEDIAVIKVTHARVRYQELVLENIDFETGSLAARGEMPVTLHVDASRGKPDEHVSLEAHFDVRAYPGTERYAVAALSVNSVVTLAGHLRTEHAGASIPAIDLDLDRQTVHVPAFTLNADGGEANGTLDAVGIADAPRVTGTLTFAPLVVREWMSRMGLTVPATRDPKALSSVAASMHFQYGGNALRFDPFTATIDDTHVSGSAAIVNLATHAVTFDLVVDQVDVDRYRPPATQVEMSRPAAAVAPPPSDPLEVNGTLTVGGVHFSALDLENVKVTVATQDRVMRVHPITADVDGGRFSGDVELDHRGPLPLLTLDEHLSGIDVGRLLAPGSKKIRFSGRGNLDLKATGRGAGADAILETLAGQFDLSIANGAVEGIDIDYALGRAGALLGNRTGASPTDTGRTPFEAFRVSAQIANGIATTHDLLIASRALRITGQGTAALPTQALDLQLLAEPLTTSSGPPIEIPVTVRGTFANPDVRPDVAAIAKGELKQRVKEVLKDKLRGLFGRP